MDLVLVRHKGYRIKMAIDIDGGMWLQKINELTDQNVEGFAYTSDVEYTITRYGGVDAFVEKVVLPKTNEFMRMFFPLDGDGTTDPVGDIPADGRARLEWIVKNLFKFDASTEQFDYTPPEG